MARSTIVVSLRSKGLASFNWHSFVDLRYQAATLATELFDLFVSALLTVTSLSWSSWISIAVMVIVAGVDLAAGKYSEEAYTSGSTDLFFPLFAFIVLPILILISLTYWRRDQAQSHLADAKAQMVALCVQPSATATNAQQKEAADEFRRDLFVLLDELHRYLQHRRPYARHFYVPYRPADSANPNDTLVSMRSHMHSLHWSGIVKNMVLLYDPGLQHLAATVRLAT